MDNAFIKIQPRNLLSKTVEEQIERAIREKKIIPGQKLPTEFELCEQFGVSRTVIRDALRMLSARGLINVIKRKGIFVKMLSTTDVSDPLFLYLHQQLEQNTALDVIRARQLIEPQITFAAAINHTEEDAEKLKKDLIDLIAHDGDLEMLSHLDLTFHLDIAKASENMIVPLLLDPIFKLMPRIKKSVYATVSDAKESAVTWHTKILEMILKRDAEGAKEAMTTHLGIAEEHVRKMLESKKTEIK
jgi:GntR family transcriptional regulator, transcriptional repressor for pyruvate dehydrogenase complex